MKKNESNIPVVSSSLSWIEKDRLAGIRLNEMRALAVDNSILNEISSKVLRQLIIEGINIGLATAKTEKKSQDAESIAQWVIDSRYPKNEQMKVSDFELYNGIIERIKGLDVK